MTVRNKPIPLHPRCGGFTLLELAVSTVVMSMIMLGLGSAMLIAGRALPEVQSVASTTTAAADAVEQMAVDLRYAGTIDQRSATMIELRVPDRNGDQLPETIRYEWSGTAGAPLLRRYNAGTAVEVLPDVREFALACDVETISKDIPQSNESQETLLFEHLSPIAYYTDYTIKEAKWYGLYFFPTLPADTISWKVTRVKCYAKLSGGLGGQTKVQLQLPTTGYLPSGVTLDEATLYESILPLLYLPYELPYAKASGLSPQQGLCIVFQWIADAEACKLLGQDEGISATNLALVRSTSQGLIWSKLTGESLQFSVYGTVTTAGTPQIQHTYYLNAVRIQLRAGNDSRSLVQTTARTLNRPEVSQ